VIGVIVRTKRTLIWIALAGAIALVIGVALLNADVRSLLNFQHSSVSGGVVPGIPMPVLDEGFLYYGNGRFVTGSGREFFWRDGRFVNPDGSLMSVPPSVNAKLRAKGLPPIQAQPTADEAVRSTATVTSNAAFRTVVHPYHNHYGDLTGVSVSQLDLDSAPAVTATPLPATVPAYLGTRRPLPQTDLRFSTRPGAGDLAPAWEDRQAMAAADSPTAKPLGDEAAAAAAADRFLVDHNLRAPDLGPPHVSWGSSAGRGGAGGKITSWKVIYDQPPVGGYPLASRGLELRVGPGDQVVSVRWNLYDWRADGELLLRPLAEVLTDQQAWQDGSPGGDTAKALGSNLHLRVAQVQLRWVQVSNPAMNDRAAHYLVPVYEFSVQALEPMQAAGTKGTWRVVAAAAVTR
jgi:hypothetical protein